MNYLQLVQTTLLLLRAGNERLDEPPESITGNKGIAYEVVQWIKLAELAIQSHRSGWLFMTRNTTVDIPAMSRVNNIAASIGDYFSMVAKSGDNDSPFMTVWQNAGDAEVKCFFYKWMDWSGSVFDREPHGITALPCRYTIQPDGQLVFDPTPQGAISCNFNYRAKPVMMDDQDDDAQPVVPEPYHQLIVYWAILKFYCLTRDKTQELRQKVQVEFDREMTKLYNEQLPAVDAGGTVLA